MNHPDKLDPVVVGLAVEEHLSSLDRPVVGIPGFKHLDPDRHKNDPSVSKYTPKIINLVRKAKGFRMISVIQRYDAERQYYLDHPEALDGKTIKEFNDDAMEETVNVLKNGGIVMIAAGGTRDKDRNIGRAQSGVELLLRAAKDHALVLPIGINLPEGKFRLGISKFVVVVGTPFSYDELEQDHRENPTIKRKDLIMQRVAKLVSRRKRGYYKDLIK